MKTVDDLIKEGDELLREADQARFVDHRIYVFKLRLALGKYRDVAKSYACEEKLCQSR